MSKVYGQRSDGNRDIVLTFDDGPNPKTTSKLLDILAENEIKAIFFVVGQLLATSEGKAIATRAQSDGHLIANHTFSHPNLRGLSESAIRDELRRTHDLVCEYAGDCTLFRPPYGSSSATVSRVLLELGYTPILWNVDTLDWKYKKDGKWVDHGMEQIKAREDSIVLMHDIHATTVDNVPQLISRIRRISGTRFTIY